jgi:preflagellin peptidase FlaK
LIYLFLALSLAVLAIAAYTDFKSREVPDSLTFPAIALGITLHAAESAFSGSLLPILLSVSGAALALASTYALWRLGAIAGGDVKLLTALAALVPAYGAGYPIFFAIVLVNGILVAAPYFFAYVAARALVRFRAEFFAKVRENLKASAASALAGVSAFLFLGGGLLGAGASLGLALAAGRFWQVSLIALPAAVLNQGTIAAMLFGSISVSLAYSLVFSVLSMRKRALRKTVRLGDAEDRKSVV